MTQANGLAPPRPHLILVQGPGSGGMGTISQPQYDVGCSSCLQGALNAQSLHQIFGLVKACCVYEIDLQRHTCPVLQGHLSRACTQDAEHKDAAFADDVHAEKTTAKGIHPQQLMQS